MNNPERSRRRELNRQLFNEGLLSCSPTPNQQTTVHLSLEEACLLEEADALLAADASLAA